MQQLAPSPSRLNQQQHGLVSLWDMFRLHLENYITLGANIATLRELIKSSQPGGGAQPILHHEGRALRVGVTSAAVSVLGQLKDACDLLELTTSSASISAAVTQGRVGHETIECLIDVVKSEMSGRLFLRVPAERANLWESDSLLSDEARKAFPASSLEIRSAGTAYACGLWSACVFHAMRAAEDALVKISDELGIVRSGSEQWGNVIDQIEARLRDIAKKPKADQEKIEKLQPLSALLIDMRLFKDAWRNQMAHSIFGYNDTMSRDILSAVSRVLEASALRLNS